MAETQKILDISCPVCLEEFDQIPKVLTCGHSFCGACVTQLENASKVYRYSAIDESVLEKTFSCPTCREWSRGAVANYILGDVLSSMKEDKNKMSSTKPTDKQIVELTVRNFELERKLTERKMQLRKANIRSKERDFWFQQCQESLNSRQNELAVITALREEIDRLKMDMVQYQRISPTDTESDSPTNAVSSEEETPKRRWNVLSRAMPEFIRRKLGINNHN